MLAADIAAQIVDQAPDALLLVDRGGSIVYVNQAVTTLFGYAPGELLGCTIEQLVPDRARALHQRYRDGFETTPSTREMGARIVALSALRRDGTEFPAEIRLAPIHRADGHFVLAAVRDVTERRLLTEELRAARAEADSANRVKSRFLATASHDLRQPLQTLQLLNAALARQVSEEASTALIQRQQSSLDSMADLLNALLDVTKLESGTLQPKLEPVTLADVLDDLRRQFEDQVIARGLTLTVHGSGNSIHTDRVLFRQMLQNLLANAIHYTREGGVTVTAWRGTTQLTVEVRDTGIGIPAGQIERIFDEYFRGESQGEQPRGFGIGLTIVRQISQLLGYTVEVTSEPGRGSVFRVQIPVSHLVESTSGKVPQPGPLVPRADVAKPAVLIIEDDDAVRDALALVLTLEGYPTLVAASAEAAEWVFAHKGSEIDVVVSDFQLGEGRNGLQVLEQLRAVAARDLPAVILSGDTSPVLASIESVPRATLLRKPVDARQLIKVIEALFGAAL